MQSSAQTLYEETFRVLQPTRSGTRLDAQAQMLASNWLHTISAMVEEMVRVASTQSTAAS